MSGRAKIAVLCEDRQQASFVRRFLLNRGWDRRDIREPRDFGHGSGEQRVREEFPQALRAYRSKANHLRNGLIVVIDADTNSVSRRVHDFEMVCDQQGVPRLRKGERVLYVIPKRNIETWIAFLAGEDVDEEADRKRHKHGAPSECFPQVDKLDETCRTGRWDRKPLPSLEHCCKDFQTFWELVKP